MIDISKKYKDILIKEIEYVVEKINQSSNANESIYYFSAIHGMIHRLMNLEYNPDFVYMHFILRNTYDIINSRLQANMHGDTVVPLEKDHFEKLAKISKELGEKIKEKKDIHETLKKFVVLSYVTTGNGYYLLQQGKFTIEDL